MIKSYLINKLTRNRPVPPQPVSDIDTAVSVIYVLGGTEQSLKERYVTAAELYRQSIAGKILILGRPGITLFDPALGRNMTNDEWSIKNLQALGVNKNAIETVSIEGDGFGTLSEARGISAIARKRGYRNLILVSSASHTGRVWLSFSAFLKEADVNVYVYGAGETTNLSGLLAEYSKLLVYDNYLLNEKQN